MRANIQRISAHQDDGNQRFHVNIDPFVAQNEITDAHVNHAVKSSFLLGFLESVPEVSAKLKEPKTAALKFEEVVRAAEQAAVLVLVY